METQPVYDSIYFFKRFSAIPETMWLVNDQGIEEKDGKYPHCAIGWCKNYNGFYGSANSAHSPEVYKLMKLFESAGIFPVTFKDSNSGWNIADVNNGDHPRYQQPTPKQRILAALADIIKLENKELPNLEGPAYRFEKPERRMIALEQMQILPQLESLLEECTQPQEA